MADISKRDGNHYNRMNYNMNDDNETIATTSDCSVDNGPLSFLNNTTAIRNNNNNTKQICVKKNWSTWIWLFVLIGIIFLSMMFFVAHIFAYFNSGNSSLPYPNNYISRNNNNNKNLSSLEDVQNYIIKQGYSSKEDVTNTYNLHSKNTTTMVDNEKEEEESSNIFSFSMKKEDNDDDDEDNTTTLLPTPQYLAAKFMMLERLPTYQEDDYFSKNYKIMWMERYVASVFYYSYYNNNNNNNNTLDDDFFLLSQNHVCHWNRKMFYPLFPFGIYCGDIQYAYRHKLPYRIQILQLIRNDLLPSSNGDGDGDKRIPWKELGLLSKLQVLDLPNRTIHVSNHDFDLLHHPE